MLTSKLTLAVAVASSVMVGPATSATAGVQVGGDTSWACGAHEVCLFPKADGDGKPIVVVSLPPDCKPVQVVPVPNATKSVRNRNSYRIKLFGPGSGSIRVNAYGQTNLNPAMNVNWVARDDC